MVKRKSIHFVLSKSKDADILAWKNSLEDGSFNHLVNEILIAESEKKIANIPCGSKKVDELQTINSRLLVYDRYAIELIESFAPKEVTSSIKKIIRKHLNKKRQAVNHSKDDRYKLIGDVLKAFEVKMIEKAQEYSGVSNKYQKLCDAYDMAINNLFIELLSCASLSSGTFTSMPVMSAFICSHRGDFAPPPVEMMLTGLLAKVCRMRSRIRATPSITAPAIS